MSRLNRNELKKEEKVRGKCEKKAKNSLLLSGKFVTITYRDILNPCS